MSSIVGHALIGAAIGKNAFSGNRKQEACVYLLFSALSISPDLDYLPTWLFGIDMEPRCSHSIFFALAMSLPVLMLRNYVRSGLLKNISVSLIFMAPLSHVLLDFFVGVHKNPILWPIDSELYTFKYGLLPSAGKLDIRNYYFWRNMAIEIGILGPIALLIVSESRAAILKNKQVSSTMLFIFLSCSFIGFALRR